MPVLLRTTPRVDDRTSGYISPSHVRFHVVNVPLPHFRSYNLCLGSSLVASSAYPFVCKHTCASRQFCCTRYTKPYKRDPNCRKISSSYVSLTHSLHP